MTSMAKIEADGYRRPARPDGFSLLRTADIWMGGRTVNGRPLDENAARHIGSMRDDLARDGIATIHAPSQYRDSRSSRPDAVYNRSALEELQANRQPMLDGMAWVRSIVVTDIDSQEPTVKDLQTLSTILIALPQFLTLRAENPVPLDAIPNSVGIMFKAGQGLHEYADVLTQAGQGDDLAHPDIVYRTADKEGALLGEDEVCAAPPNTIRQTVDALVNGVGGDPERSELQDLVPDADALVTFSKIFFLKDQVLKEYEQNKIAFVGSVMDMEDTVDDGFIEDLVTYNEGQQRLVDKLNTVQYAFNMVLGNDPDTAPPMERTEIEEWTNTKIYDIFDKETVEVVLADVVEQVHAHLGRAEGQLPLAEETEEGFRYDDDDSASAIDLIDFTEQNDSFEERLRREERELDDMQ